MKRNMIPLLAIAFVVAIVSTGVFYGLFAGKLKSNSAELPTQAFVVATRNLERGTVLTAADLRTSEFKGTTMKGSFTSTQEAVGGTLLEAVKQNEPLLAERVASRNPKATGTVPAGMRAISVRVAESTGVMSLVRAGSRVDVQAVLDRNGSSEIRTVLQNVEVLTVSPQMEATGNRAPVPVVTLLANSRDADLIALADSSARIRLALRNPLDDDTLAGHPLGLAAVFLYNGGVGLPTESQQRAQRTETTATSAANTLPDQSIQLHVEVLRASLAALGELSSKLANGPSGDALHVTAFSPQANAAELLRNLERRQEVEVVSDSSLSVGLGHSASFRAGSSPYQLRVQFTPETDAAGTVTLKVNPEITVQSSDGVETRRYFAGLPNGGCFLVKGLLKDQTDPKILERLYPGHAWGGRELLIFVTSRPAKQVPVSASVVTNRRP